VLNEIIRRDKPGITIFVPASGKVRLSVISQYQPGEKIGDYDYNEPELKLIAGQQVMVTATINRVHNYQTPGSFDYISHMHNREIYFSGWLRSEQNIMPIASKSYSLLTKIYFYPQHIRQQIHDFLTYRENNLTSGIYKALLIGDRSSLPAATIEQFVNTGTMHLLAISGLHIGLLSLLLYTIIYSLLKRSEWLLLHTHLPSLSLILCFPVLIGYAFIAGMNIPVLRAVLSAGLMLFAVLVRRPHSILHLISGAALTILIIQPAALFSVSFQLSFSAVLAIGFVYPKLPIPDKTKNPGRLKSASRWIISALLVSVAATIGTLPFLLYHFNRFSPIGPVMTLLIEPFLCFIALPIGLLAIPAIFFAPGLAGTLFTIGGYGIIAANYLTGWAGQFSYASIWTVTPTITEIICYALLIFLFLKTNRTNKKSVFIIIGSVLLIAKFTAGLYLDREREFTTISYLDVGQGSATIIENDDGSVILIDGGGNFSDRFNVGHGVIAPFLGKQRIWRIDKLIITHPDSDHYNGLSLIINRFKPKTVYTNGRPDQAKLYKEIMMNIERMGIQKKTPKAGEIIHTSRLCTLSCLGMPGIINEPSFSDNNKSLVMILTCGKSGDKKRFLFPGDIEQESERLLLDNNIHVAADILLSPHHGSRSSSSPGFIETVNPKLIIVSAGRAKTNFPAEIHRQRWQQQQIPFLITGETGTVICETDGIVLLCQSISQKQKNTPEVTLPPGV
jgi:competence protein ComEC